MSKLLEPLLLGDLCDHVTFDALPRRSRNAGAE